MITKPVQNLFDFIDWLHSKIDYFLSQQHLVNEFDRLSAEMALLKPNTNYKDKLEKDRLRIVLRNKFDEIESNIICLIKDKIKELGISDMHTGSHYLSACSDLVQLKETFKADDVKKILEAKKKILEYREEIPDSYFLNPFFSNMDRDLREFFEQFQESESELLPLSDKATKILLTKVSEPPQQSMTATLIYNLFEQGTKNGWEEIFNTETDYLQFVNILTAYFEFNPLNIDGFSFKIKSTTKTRTAAILRSVHKSLGDKSLKKDFEFFRIIRLLQPFKDAPNDDIYKALTK